MRFKYLFLWAVALTFLFYPGNGETGTVSWETGTYRAFSYAVNQDGFDGTIWAEDSQESLSPPLSMPIEASAFAETEVHPRYPDYIHADAYSSASNSSFHVFADASSWCCEEAAASAESSFTGTFTASAPVFEFSYGLATSYNDWGYTPYTPMYDSWLTVTDLTSSTTLFDTTFSDGSKTVSVLLTSGHSIEVNFGVTAVSAPPCCWKSAATQDATLTFSTSVAPEPVSTVLFLSGGTLLAVRRFTRSKK